MTLNDLERCNSPYFAFFFTEFDRFSGRLYYITLHYKLFIAAKVKKLQGAVVEDRPIMSVKYCLPVPVFHFW